MTQDQIDMLCAIYQDLHRIDPTKLKPESMLAIASCRPIDFHHARTLLSRHRRITKGSDSG
jgi:hypothetical protein